MPKNVSSLPGVSLFSLARATKVLIADLHKTNLFCINRQSALMNLFATDYFVA